MNTFKAAFFLTAFLMLGACVTTTVEKGSKRSGEQEASAWSVSQLPRIAGEEDFEDVLLRLRFGTDQQRRTTFVALQLYIDICLPFIIDHLEDTDKFVGSNYPLVSRAGVTLGQISIPAKGFNLGAALERFLVSYFYDDPARRTFNVKVREGATSVWEEWYLKRQDSFDWRSPGLYRSR